MENKVVIWEKLTGNNNLWIPTKDGENLQGIVHTIEPSPYGKVLTVRVKGEKEDKFIKTPSHKVLQSLIEDVKQGDYLRITFLGKTPSKKKGYDDTNLYEVERAK